MKFNCSRLRHHFSRLKSNKYGYRIYWNLLFWIMICHFGGTVPLCFSDDVSHGADQSLDGPIIFFPDPHFRFSSMVEGEAVLHDFIVMNKGTKTLTVEKVKTTCGCTTVSYSKEILPGESGKITMKVNTRGYGGRKLTKQIYVMSNDTSNPNVELSVSGSIEKFVTITPSVIRFNGKADQEMKSVVSITPEKKYPFNITGITAQNGKHIIFEMRTLSSESGEPLYRIIVQNTKHEKGNYFDILTLTTDSTIQPEIKITILGHII